METDVRLIKGNTLLNHQVLHDAHPRVGRAQVYRLSVVSANTVAQDQYTGKKYDKITCFVIAWCCVQNCELSNIVLGMTQNCIHTE